MPRSAAAFDHSEQNESGEHEIAIELDRDRERIAAFHTAVSNDVDPGRNTDDEITIEAPIPEIPDSVPSPISNDELLVPDTERDPAPAAKSSVREAMSLAGIPAMVFEPFGQLAKEPSPGRAQLGSESSIGVTDLVSSRPRVSPADAQAVRDARAAARRDLAHTRLVVLAIWGLATVLTAFLAVIALR